jgi:lysozyme
MQFNQKGLDLIKQFEGCKLAAYQDLKGIWTIGYGQTGPDIVEGLVWDQRQCDIALDDHCVKLGAAIENLIEPYVTNNEFSAMVCLAYNIGIGAFGGSTLLRLFNAHNTKGASDQFLVWDKVNGETVAGLLRRRQAEQALFNEG